MGIAFEQPFQAFFLTKLPCTFPALAFVYYSHIFVGALFLVYAYTFFPRPTFQRVRRTLAMDNWIAFIILTTWRCAPPRLLPTEYGFVDVLHPQNTKTSSMGYPASNATDVLGPDSGSVWTNNSHQLTIAAMPSLHFGTALLIGFSLFTWSPHPAVRVMAPLWPVAMFVTIIATANHFVLDAVAGAFVVLLGWRMNEVLLVFRPLEEWLFGILRMERPRSAEMGRHEAGFASSCD